MQSGNYTRQTTIKNATTCVLEKVENQKMSKKWKVENLVDEASDTEESDVEQDEERPLKSSDDDEDELSGLDIPEAKLPVLRSIVSKGKTVDHDQQRSFQGSERGEEAEKLAIREELSALTFEELQKLKEKIGSKKFNQTLIGIKKKPQVRTDFKRANPNRPREISSKSRRIEPKVAIQVPKVFRSDPRFDNLCGEFHEKVCRHPTITCELVIALTSSHLLTNI
jgi:ribosomal RNA-processing protein 36